jgi:hypothetical protein
VASRRVIVVSMPTLFDDTLHGSVRRSNNHDSGLAGQPGGVNDGLEVWNKFLRLHPNISFVFNGHVLNDGNGRLVSTGKNGNQVHQMLANYQMLPNGGNGYLRLVEFDTAQGTVSVKSYSPYLDQFLTDSENQFEYRTLIWLSMLACPGGGRGNDRCYGHDYGGAETVVLRPPSGPDGGSFPTSGGKASHDCHGPSVTFGGNTSRRADGHGQPTENRHGFRDHNGKRSGTLFQEDFASGDLAGWTGRQGTVNALLKVVGSELVQSSNIYGPSGIGG